MASNGFNVRRARGPVAPPPAAVSTDYDPLPPPPPARPASAVGWAYDAPKGGSSASVVAAPKARAMPVMVEEDADSEVAAVTARLAAASLPPSAALAHAASSRQQAPAPPLAPAPAVKAAKAAVSYSFLVPQAPATAADAPGASEESKRATQLARAEANESLYGDRACQALPTRAVRRGCLNPIVDCVAPGQRGGGGGMRGDDEDDDDAGGRGGAGSRAGAAPSGQGGGIVASVANSLSNLASYFGVGASDDDPYAAAEEEAAVADAARRAAAKQVGGNSPSPVAQHVGAARAASAADNAEESAMAFEAAWRERQRLREAGASRLEADAAVTGLDPVAMAASAPSPPPPQQQQQRMPTPPSPQPLPPASQSPDRMAAAGFAPQTASPARGGFDPAASMVAARAAAVASAAEAAPPPPPTAPVPAPSAQDMFNAPMRSRLKSGSAAAAAAKMDAEMARRMSSGGN